MDRTRLQPSITEMAAAEAAYDAALKRLAAATRVTAQNPSDPTAVRAGQLAAFRHFGRNGQQLDAALARRPALELQLNELAQALALRPAVFG
jgi:hypothetical protein